MSMWNVNARIQRLDTRSRRIIAISDIHANMPYFKGLLEKVDFSENDELIIDGDFLEKGQNSLETLRFIMELSERGNCHTVCGNCDTWADVIDAERRYWDERIVKYMTFKKSGLVWDMLTEMGIEITPELDFTALIPELSERFKHEWNFLLALPHVIETPHYIFVHGGIKPDVPIERHGIARFAQVPASVLVILAACVGYIHHLIGKRADRKQRAEHNDNKQQRY